MMDRQVRSRLSDFEEPLGELRNGAATLIVILERMSPLELTTKSLAFAAVGIGDAAEQLYRLWHELMETGAPPSKDKD